MCLIFLESLQTLLSRDLGVLGWRIINVHGKLACLIGKRSVLGTTASTTDKCCGTHLQKGKDFPAVKIIVSFYHSNSMSSGIDLKQV